MGRVLITGGYGYVGRNLAQHLREKGEEVVLFDDVVPTEAKREPQEGVVSVQGDLGSLSEVLEAVRAYRPDCIFHLGALISVAAEANPWAAYSANANGTYHVLEAARIFEVSRVLFLSGIATYGPGSAATVNEDTFQSNPSQIYAATKIFGERLGEYYHHRFKVDFRCASLPAICGPGRREGLAAYPSLMVHEAARGRPCRLPVDGSAQLPFIYIKDVVRCLESLRDADASILQRRIYSISGFSLTADAMADVVREFVPDARIDFLADPRIAGLVRLMPKHVDDRRAREDWGWQTAYDWRAAVRDFIAAVRAQPGIYP
jgi:threonine 3-dehydrogenase